MATPQIYYKHSLSLAQYQQIEDHKSFWEDRWRTRAKGLLQRAKLGLLYEFEYPFQKYLPQKGPILEAGCGTGMYVCALQARGYQIEGIDYAEETVSQVRQIEPSLNISVGDILAIERPDNHYAAYISIGVFEHNFDGPEAALAETYRVLQSGGIALISVPYMNWARRRFWRGLPEATTAELSSGLSFYQDHFDVRQFRGQITAAGFKVLELYPYSLFTGLVKDWRLGRWLRKRTFFNWRLARLAKRSCELMPRWMRKDLSHMMMFICQKPAMNDNPLR